MINIAALFTIARICKQPKCPLADKYADVVVHIHNGILLSYKKEQIWVNSNEVDELERIIQSEVSQKEKHQYSRLTHIYGI